VDGLLLLGGTFDLGEKLDFQVSREDAKIR
jgi:hypothetical protein